MPATLPGEQSSKTVRQNVVELAGDQRADHEVLPDGAITTHRPFSIIHGHGKPGIRHTVMTRGL